MPKKSRSSAHDSGELPLFATSAETKPALAAPAPPDHPAPEPVTAPDSPISSSSKHTQSKVMAKSSSPSSSVRERRLIVPLQAKGTIGKTTTISLIAEYLTQIGENWRGFDLDERNNEFVRTFEDNVKSVPLANEEHIDNVARILAHGMTSNVVILDPQAFTDQLLRDALRITKFLDVAPEQGIKTTVLVFPFQEETVMREIVETYEFVDGRAEYILVYNLTKPGEIKNRFQMFYGSPLERTFLEAGAKQVFIPHLLERTRLKHRELINRLGRGVRYGEFVKNTELDIDFGQRGIMEDWLSQVFWQFDEVAELLTSPEGLELARERHANHVRPSKLITDLIHREDPKKVRPAVETNFMSDEI